MGASSSSELIDSVSALQRDEDADEAHLERVLPGTPLAALDAFAVLQPDVVRDLLRDRPRNLARLVLKVGRGAGGGRVRGRAAERQSTLERAHAHAHTHGSPRPRTHAAAAAATAAAASAAHAAPPPPPSLRSPPSRAVRRRDPRRSREQRRRRALHAWQALERRARADAPPAAAVRGAG
jgi:hypothetical protein